MTLATDQVQTVLSESRLGRHASESLQNSLIIIRILLESKCCARCCLRYLGCTDFRLYALDEPVLFEAYDTIYIELGSTEFLPPSTDICTACLGSIQYADTFVEDVCQQLAQQDYKTDSVCITCTLPVSILSRDHLLKVHVTNTLIKEGHTDLVRVWEADKDVRDPKDFFKYLFGMGLRQKTGLSLDTDALFRMNVVVGHEPSSKEHMFLTALKEPLLNIRSIRQKVHIYRKKKGKV